MKIFAADGQKRARREKDTGPAGAETEQLRADGNWWCLCSKHSPLLTTNEYLCCHNWQIIMALFMTQFVLNISTLQSFFPFCLKWNVKENQDHIDLMTRCQPSNRTVLKAEHLCSQQIYVLCVWFINTLCNSVAFFYIYNLSSIASSLLHAALQLLKQ